MSESSLATRKANKAAAGDLVVSVPTCDKNFSFSVKATCDLCDDERAQIWRIFEENMRELYRSSSFGWKPRKKQAEMFHSLSRFVIARDTQNPAGPRLVAYTIFRFERVCHQNVIYCYELQVSKDSRRFGLGKMLTRTLADIGAQWGMTKIMLTVFKANHAARSFYGSMGFTTDETSPDFFEDLEGGLGNECDYSILSKCIP